ncbi:DUF2799 domain-containing protein [Musicola paradisiaca]|nr:DUF2799 domain-containing protein [Musicola paradisiaca]
MLKNCIWSLGIVLLTGCHPNVPVPQTARDEVSVWYEAGYQDAVAGSEVRDNDTLSEWFGDPQVDRESYLQGYTAGQAVLCHPGNIRLWGKDGKPFPLGCSSDNHAEQLRRTWQESIDNATSR